MRVFYLNSIRRDIEEVLDIPEWEFFDRLKTQEMADFVLAVYIGNRTDDEFYMDDRENLISYQIKTNRITIRTKKGTGFFQYGWRICKYELTMNDIMRIVTGLQYAWSKIHR